MNRQESEKMERVRPWSFVASALVLLALLCVSVRRVTPPTLIDQWQSLPAISLDCREHRDDGLSLESWPQAVVWGASVVRIVPDELVTDGDLLWISTHRGLIRLNTRTLACTIFTQAAQVSLAEAYLLLPDGEGGLWASTRRGLLHFSGGRWHMVYRTPSGTYPARIHDVGLRQDGDVCVVVQDSRFAQINYFCFKESPFDPTDEVPPWATLDDVDCNRWQRVAASDLAWPDWKGKPFYDFMTPAECRRAPAIKGHSFVTMSPDASEIWGMKDGRLFHWQGQRGEALELPYVDVHALAADLIHGGVWMATEQGLVHAQVDQDGTSSTGTRYVLQPFSFNPGMFSLNKTLCPYLYTLSVDKSGQVWMTVPGWVLRYDEADQVWREVRAVASEGRSDAGPVLAADPARGVWVAGGQELAYFDGAQWQSWPIPQEDVSSSYYKSSTALLVDENRRIWLGHAHTGVWTADPTAQSALDWRQFTRQDGLADERITALARSPDGRMYAGHHAGISALAGGVENGRWTTLPDSGISAKGWVNALAFAPPQFGGALWAGYYGDAPLRRYEDGRWTDYLLPFAKHSIGALLVDGDGALWVGSAEGLWRWPLGADGARGQAFDPDLHGPFIYQVLALAQDAEGRIWVGGREGVAMLKEPVGE
jgi:ligand-binding sensor domain-containing protein